LVLALVALQATLVVLVLTNQPPGPNSPIPSPAGASTSLVHPITGTWIAHGTILNSTGSNEPVGENLTRSWSIYHACVAARCSFYLERQTASTPLTAPLQPHGSVWYAQFPPQTNPCGQNASGETTYWQTQTRFLIRFSPDGNTFTAGERNYSSAPNCGYGLVTATWNGTLSTPTN
jgi:hypothetical protein